MPTNRLTSDKLRQQLIKTLYDEFWKLYATFTILLDESTPNEALKAQIKRQMDSIEAIIRKEYKKSIEQKCQIHEHCDGSCEEWHN